MAPLMLTLLNLNNAQKLQQYTMHKNTQSWWLVVGSMTLNCMHNAYDNVEKFIYRGTHNRAKELGCRLLCFPDFILILETNK